MTWDEKPLRPTGIETGWLCPPALQSVQEKQKRVTSYSNTVVKETAASLKDSQRMEKLLRLSGSLTVTAERAALWWPCCRDAGFAVFTTTRWGHRHRFRDRTESKNESRSLLVC